MKFKLLDLLAAIFALVFNFHLWRYASSNYLPTNLQRSSIRPRKFFPSKTFFDV